MPPLPDLDPAMLLSAAGQRELAAATAPTHTLRTPATRVVTAREDLPLADDAWISNLVTNYTPEDAVESNEISFDEVPLDVGAHRATERRDRFRVDRPPPARPFTAREVHGGQSDGRVVGNVREFRSMTREQRAQVREPDPEQMQELQEAERQANVQRQLAAERHSKAKAVARERIPTDYDRLTDGDFLDRWDDFSV